MGVCTLVLCSLANVTDSDKIHEGRTCTYILHLSGTYLQFSCVVQEEYKPPLKLKLSRKDGSRESPCFEINKPIISSLLRPGWIELQKLARQQQQQQAALLASSPSAHARHSFSPPPQLASPKEAGSPAIRLIPAGLVGGRAAYSPISSPDLSTRSSPPPPVLLSPPLRSAADSSGAVIDRPPSPVGKKAPRPRKGVVLAAENNTSTASSEPNPQPQEVSDPPGSVETPSDRGGRGPSRGRRLLACPLCGAEYALATTLEKHIDRDHKEENAPAATGRRTTKRASRSADRSPTKKRKTASSEGLAASITSADGGSSVAESADRPKLTEYEIFQSLQLPADRKTVACTLCGQLMPPNTLKRHLARYME
jgi:hypothetical protein